MITSSGLVSITFRKLKPAEIVDLVVRGELTSVEWGGDIHVPHGDVDRARDVRRLTEDAGLDVAAYGSYFRVLEPDGSGADFDPVLKTAEALGAPTIRVWAGLKGSADVDAPGLQNLADALRAVAGRAEGAGVRVALEFHGGTYTDTTASTLQLLKAVDHGNLDTLWQPPVGMGEDDCVASLTELLPWVSNVHVFHWAPQGERQGLADGTSRWTRYLDVLANSKRAHRLLMEFVQNDSEERFLEDAKVLGGWVDALRAERRIWFAQSR